jgi:hypothetical protein
VHNNQFTRLFGYLYGRISKIDVPYICMHVSAVADRTRASRVNRFPRIMISRAEKLSSIDTRLSRTAGVPDKLRIIVPKAVPRDCVSSDTRRSAFLGGIT